MGQIDVTRLLLERNADPRQRDRAGETVLDAAKNETIKKLLNNFKKD